MYSVSSTTTIYLTPTLPVRQSDHDSHPLTDSTANSGYCLSVALVCMELLRHLSAIWGGQDYWTGHAGVYEGFPVQSVWSYSFT